MLAASDQRAGTELRFMSVLCFPRNPEAWAAWR